MAPTTWIDLTRRSVVNRRVRPFLNFSLIGLLIVSFTTGWVASLLGLTEYPPHKYTSIGFFLVAGVHLALHWSGLVVQARRIWSPQPIGVSLRSQPKPLSSDEMDDGFDQLDEASVRSLNQWLRHHPGVRAVIHLQVDVA